MRAALALIVLVACKTEAPPPAERAHQTIRVAVIGGMMETGFWPQIAARYERASGDKIELVATGPKPEVIAAFRKGGIDLITVHACDAMINLVADGLARDPQPWVRNDLVIVGPAADPAGIRGEPDALVALQRIVATRSPLLVSASFGADGVLHDLQEAGKVTLDATATTRYEGEQQQRVLAEANVKGAYTLVGRIPMLLGKLKQDGMEIMVRGDARMRRPYLVEIAPHAPAAARDLAAWLRSPPTQAFIATFEKGTYDQAPLFFPVTVP